MYRKFGSSKFKAEARGIDTRDYSLFEVFRKTY